MSAPNGQPGARFQAKNKTENALLICACLTSVSDLFSSCQLIFQPELVRGDRLCPGSPSSFTALAQSHQFNTAHNIGAILALMQPAVFLSLSSTNHHASTYP